MLIKIIFKIGILKAKAVGWKSLYILTLIETTKLLTQTYIFIYNRMLLFCQIICEKIFF